MYRYGIFEAFRCAMASLFPSIPKNYVAKSYSSRQSARQLQESRISSWQCSTNPTFGEAGLSASLNSVAMTMEAPHVDLALKLNVLAVCAVFVFVAAILLGAF
jgi:hypothetical protein